MDASPEPEVPVRLPVEDAAVRLVELAGGSRFRGRGVHHDRLPWAERLTVDLDVLGDCPVEPVDRTGEADELFDRGGNKLGVLYQLVTLVRVGPEIVDANDMALDVVSNPACTSSNALPRTASNESGSPSIVVPSSRLIMSSRGDCPWQRGNFVSHVLIEADGRRQP